MILKYSIGKTFYENVSNLLWFFGTRAQSSQLNQKRREIWVRAPSNVTVTAENRKFNLSQDSDVTL